MVEVLLHSGLANRMRVLASCMYLQNTVKQRFTYYWSQDDELNASFEELFEPLPAIEIHPTDLRHRLLNFRKVRYGIWKKFIRGYYRYLLYDTILSDIEINRIKREKDQQKLSELPENKRILIWTCEEFGNNLPYFKYFRPKQSLLEEINRRSAEFPEVIYGIHIRQTDQVVSIRKSPVSLFIHKMEEVLKLEPEAHFYVSTDEPKVQEQLIQQFGSKILLLENKSFTRNSLQGMEAAVLDMFLLSKTRKIYGSFWSSFNEVAARLGQIPLEQLTKSEGIAD
jgi:hypothetical protein